MTTTIKQQQLESKDVFNGALSLACYVMDITKKVKNKDKDIESVVKACQKYVLDTKDWESLRKIFFDLKDNNTTFYSRYLKAYFESQGVFFSYNVKKDKVFYSGNFDTLTLSYTQWKEEEKKERQQQLESLSIQERLLKKYNFEKLSKDDLKVLSSILNEKIKKTI